MYRKASHVLHQYEIMSHDTILLGWLPRFQLIVNPFSWSTHEMNGGLFAIHYFLRGFQHEGYLDCKSWDSIALKSFTMNLDYRLL